MLFLCEVKRALRVALSGWLTLRVSLVLGLLQLLVASTFLTQEASTAAQALHAWEEKHEIVKVRAWGGRKWGKGRGDDEFNEWAS
jgi:hypothetical protein